MRLGEEAAVPSEDPGEDKVWREWTLPGLVVVLFRGSERSRGTGQYAREYHALHRRHAFLTVGLVALSIWGVFQADWIAASELRFWLGIAAAVTAVGVYFALIVSNARCPACRRRILKMHGSESLYVPTVCPLCGTKLR